ncbi:ARF guanine-nucleotide exchange factor GNL2 [Primulina tabacum]|uniref:ARF guanine-nucleotide exchange factor GNL2 n=1 Tax=Primulina tabacum TaxID=48773 RepID=UPI003F59223D
MDNKEHDETIKSNMTKAKRKELGVSCMLNTEIGAVLAVIRRAPDQNTGIYHHPDENFDASILQSLKSLRALLFNPQQEWRTVDPSLYLSPFLDVIQSDDIPAAATAVALQSILKILRLGVFDEKTPGAKDVVNLAVTAITGCRLQRTNPAAEEAVMMRILQVLTLIMRHRASVLLTDHSVCTVVNTCFQVVQQSTGRGDLLQRNGRYTMHELIQIIYSRLPEIEVNDWENSESDTEDNNMDTGYGIRSAIDIFHFLCSLLNVVEIMDTDGLTSDENIQHFALVLINSAIELSGDSIGKHPKLLRKIHDDLFHHLIHYGANSSPLVLSMICSTVLNIYHFLRRSIRLQLEAFFSYVLLKVPNAGSPLQLQEVAIEAVVNFCRQPSFIVEAYVNYDCDPTFSNVFEKTGKLLCKYAFPTGGALTSIQVQAFEGLVGIFHNIADNIDKEEESIPSGMHLVEISGYRPFWEEKPKEENTDSWVDYVRVRKLQKRKILIAGSHFNRDDKKGLEYLKISRLISDPPDPKAHALFFRYTPRLDKTMIGDYLGDPDDFHIQVLNEFTNTFEFSGMILDTALRTYLETFRLPGESQKIQRILEAFSEKFYDQQSSEIFVSKDAVFVLCYSLIMLNTDQHNAQVKKKMTEEEFIRNNRAINGGSDLPREYLSELFHSIATNAIAIFNQSGTPAKMNPSRWIQLINRSKIIQPYILCDFDRRIGRDMFATIAGPSVATLAAVFEHTDDEEILHECIEALFSISRIAQYGLEDTLDELLSTFSKFTALLNPYATAEETLYAFSNDIKPKMATLAIFTVANTFKGSIRGGWRTIIDCLLKLKRLKLLPQSVLEPENDSDIVNSESQDEKLDSGGVVFPSNVPKVAHFRRSSGIMGRFVNILSMETVEEALNLGLSEFEQNMKIIQHCRIGSIFTTSSILPDDSILDLGRCIIFTAAGKGQKFSTSIEEEETVAFCWDLINSISLANMHRFSKFWPQYHEFFLEVAQFPLFSPIPFAEKAILCLMKMCLKLLASELEDVEELIFKSINLMWRMEKEILDTCCEFLLQSVSKIITEYPDKLLTQLGWMSVLNLLSVTGRHHETYDQGVETLIGLMSDEFHITRTNYSYCIDCAFSFVALKHSRVECNVKIMDLLAESANLLVEWYRTGYSDPGSCMSMASNTSISSIEESTRIYNPVSFFQKLGESLRKTSLARREEVRNRAVISLQKCFVLAEDILFTPMNCINSFYNIVFAMVDDLHEKMQQYSRRENAERETRSMENTLKLSMEVLTELCLHFLMPISESPNFRTFWLGILRRMDTCMKADLGGYGESKIPNTIPDLLRKIVQRMKEKEILTLEGDDDLWDTTFYQIQWIAPALTDELFPEGLKKKS